LAAGYLLMNLVIPGDAGAEVPGRRALGRRLLRRLAGVALAGALLLHVEAEVLDLKIGWFSFYMLLAAVVFFAPERWLDRAAVALTWPARRASERLAPRPDPPEAALAAAALGGGAWLYAAFTLDVPGAHGASAL